MSMSDGVGLRGALTLEAVRQLQLGASAGYLHSRAIAELGAASVAGDALSGDVGATWRLSAAVIATARYSVAYQFARGAVEASMIHAFLVGFTVRYSNVASIPPMPTLGGRVDRGDAVGFPGQEGSR